MEDRELEGLLQELTAEELTVILDLAKSLVSEKLSASVHQSTTEQIVS